MKKILAMGLTAAALVVAVAGPASAGENKSGYMYSYSCHAITPYPNTCSVVLHPGGLTYNYTYPRKDGYMWNCSKYGTPEGANISESNMRGLLGKWVSVTWHQSPGYRDNIT